MYPVGDANRIHAVPKVPPLKPIRRRRTKTATENHAGQLTDVSVQAMTDKNPKTIQTCFRLEPATHALLHARAQAAGLSTKLWLDRAIVENKTRIIAKTTPHPELRPLLYQVNKAGADISALARHVNAMRLENPVSAATLSTVLQTLERIERQLQQAMEHAC